MIAATTDSSLIAVRVWDILLDTAFLFAWTIRIRESERIGAMATDTVRIEEYSGVIQNKLVAVWQAPDTGSGPWLPTEFMLSQYITRVLITGRSAAISAALSADQSWTQVWRSPGNKEWSCLLNVLPHMPGPTLVVVGTDIGLTPKLVTALQGTRTHEQTTVLVLRQIGAAGWVGDAADQVFFPVGAPLSAIQEWAGRATPRNLDFKTLGPQLAAQHYGLTVADGAWQWYKPADSTGLATLSVPQIAKQLQILGSLLATAAV